MSKKSDSNFCYKILLSSFNLFNHKQTFRIEEMYSDLNDSKISTRAGNASNVVFNNNV